MLCRKVKSWKFWAALFSLVFLVTLSVRPPQAAAQYPGKGKQLMPRLADGALHINGELSEWQDKPFGYLDAAWDSVEGEPSTEHRDRAIFHVAYDSHAFYFAIRVVDENVQSSSSREELWQGDCVELFLDVRPPEAPEGTPKLGQQQYTPGCYQLLLAPPNSSESEPRWYCSRQSGAAPKQMDLAGKLLEEGYVLEFRIPFLELNQTQAERFDAPIGFDVTVDDIDLPEPHRVRYSWGGKAGNYQNASQFQRALPEAPGAPRSKLIRLMGGRFSNHTRTLTAGVVFPSGEDVPQTAFRLSYHFRSTRFDRPENEEDWEVPKSEPSPQPTATEAVEERMDPVLKLLVIERMLRFTRLVGGRYTFESRFEGLGEVVEDTVRAYYTESKRQSHMDVLDKLTDNASLTKAVRERIFLTASPYHVFDAPQTEMTAFWRHSPEIDWGLSEQAERGEQDEQVHRLRLDVYSTTPSERVVYTNIVPLHRRPLKLYLPTSELAEGVYLVRARIIDPAGEVHEAWSPLEGKQQNPFAPTIFLGVHRQRDYVLKTTLESSKTLLTRAMVVGNPNRERFPKDDKLHCYARSVWDLHFHQGRIYIGCGDWEENQGPIDIWSFGAPEGAGARVTFTKEFTVNDESVNLIRSFAGRLLVPGSDPKESWEFGNLYIKENSQWRKMRTIPNGLHAFDATYFADKLYVTTGTERGAALYESSDWGKTWTRYSTDDINEFTDGLYGEMAILGDVLLVTTPRGAEYLYQFKDGKFERLVIPIFPGMSGGGMLPHRLTPFAGGVLYTFHLWREEDTPKPLFFLKGLEQGAVVVQQFLLERVQDILVRDDVCYVLTSRAVSDGYANAIYQSSDLKKWTLVAKFHTGALAYSLEQMDDVFYVGLASFSDQPHAESGTICRIEP